MFKIVVLLCALGMPHQDCSLSSAMDVVRSQKVSNEQQCGFMAQAQLASTVLWDPEKQYVKIVCAHIPQEASNR